MSAPDVRRGRPGQEAPSTKSASTTVRAVSASGASRHLTAHAIAVLPDGLQQAIQQASTDWWFDGAQTALRQLAATSRGFTVEDLFDLVGQPPAPEYAGAAMAAAQKSKIIEAVGCRVAADGRLVRVWWGVDA